MHIWACACVGGGCPNTHSFKEMLLKDVFSEGLTMSVWSPLTGLTLLHTFLKILTKWWLLAISQHLRPSFSGWCNLCTYREEPLSPKEFKSQAEMFAESKSLLGWKGEWFLKLFLFLLSVLSLIISMSFIVYFSGLASMLVLKQDNLGSKSQERGRLLSLIRYRIWNWFFSSLLYLINTSYFLGLVWFRIIRQLTFEYGSPFPLINSVMSIFILYSRECLYLHFGTYPKFDCLGENSLFCACKICFRWGRKEVGQILYPHILIQGMRKQK